MTTLETWYEVSAERIRIEGTFNSWEAAKAAIPQGTQEAWIDVCCRDTDVDEGGAYTRYDATTGEVIQAGSL